MTSMTLEELKEKMGYKFPAEQANYIGRHRPLREDVNKMIQEKCRKRLEELDKE